MPPGTADYYAPEINSNFLCSTADSFLSSTSPLISLRKGARVVSLTPTQSHSTPCPLGKGNSVGFAAHAGIIWEECDPRIGMSESGRRYC